ncbi:MAG: tyrosine-type recombinase/integrase [Burkholderiales bacterium]
MKTLITARGLTRDIEAFLRFKRAMGFRYYRAEITLNGFVRFMGQHWGEETPVALDLAVRRWSNRIAGRKGVTVSQEFGTVRQLCLYRRRSDPSGYVPEHALAPIKESVFLPYIFTHDEVCQMLVAASEYQARSVIWHPMLRTLILVLYCTGLRLGEAVRLQKQDVDLRRGTLMVRHSKGRTRIVAFRDDLACELKRYVAARRHLIDEGALDDTPALFLRLGGKPLTVRAASDTLRGLLRRLGMKSSKGRTGPRPYELRHAFAVHRLTAWAVAGGGVHARLPWLSAYLGHQNVLGTEVYLKATPQLLELASGRFAEHLRRARRPR